MSNMMGAMRGALAALAHRLQLCGPAAVVLALLGMTTAPEARAGSCADGGTRTLVRSLRSEDGEASAGLSRGCATHATRATAPRKRTGRNPARGSSYVASGTMVYCVRPSDGYFFPTPHSQFRGEKDLATTVDMCRAICADPQMDVYALHDPSLETDSMVSLTSGAPYLELQSAHAFREKPDFAACDMQRYFRALDRARAKAVKPGDLGDTIVPLPTSRPDHVAAVDTEPAPIRRQPTLRVRDVGPVYLPD